MPRLSLSEKALLYGGFRACLYLKVPNGVLAARIKKYCQENYGIVFWRKTIAAWVKKWAANKNILIFKEESRNQSSPRKFSPFGISTIQKNAIGNNYRGLSRTLTVEARDGTETAISRMAAKRYSQAANLTLSIPKRQRVRTHTSHHKRFRMVMFKRIARKGKQFTPNMHFSDEMNFPVTLAANTKNDVILVPVGQQSKTNIQRFSVGSEKSCFSLFWVLSQFGVVAYSLYEGTLDMKRFEELLHTVTKDGVERERQLGHHASVFVHDRVTNSNDYPIDTLDTIYGPQKHLLHIPPVCRIKSGRKLNIE